LSAELLKLPCPHCGKKLRIPDRSILGKKIRCPACRTGFVASLTTPDPAPVLVPPQQAVITPAPPPKETATQEETSSGQIQIVVAPPAPRRVAKRSSGNPRLWGFVVGGSLVMGLSLVAYFLVYRPSISIESPLTRVAPASNTPSPVTPAPSLSGVSTEPESPLTLQHLPGGIRLFVHLRPREWLLGGRGSQELLKLSGTSGEWFARQVRENTYADLSELDELLLGWILGAAGDPPRFVCRYKRNVELGNELLESRLGSEFQPGTDGAWRQSESTAVWLIGDQTVVIVPSELSSEVSQAATSPLPTDLGVEEVLQRSSSSDQLVIVGVPLDLATHQSALADPGFKIGWNALLAFIEQEHRHAEAFSLSARWTSSETLMTLRVKASNAAKMNNVRTTIESRLVELPGLAQQGLASDQIPTGFLQIARRFPSMLKVLQGLAIYEITGRQVVVRSQLPERALPNLMLGGILLWHNQVSPVAPQTTPPSDASAEFPEKQATPENKHQTAVELLQKLIDVDFRREPLEGAVKTVGEEIGCGIEIDGDALKLSGYTRNMPQTLQLEQYPAGGILQKIIAQYDQMVLAVIDGTPESLLVTTKEAAAKKKLKTLQLEVREIPVNP